MGWDSMFVNSLTRFILLDINCSFVLDNFGILLKFKYFVNNDPISSEYCDQETRGSNPTSEKNLEKNRKGPIRQ